MKGDLLSSGFIITVIVLLVELALFAFCYFQSKKPVDPLKPRIIPYALIMVVLAAAILATLAHIVSVVTGQQVEPRRPKGMR
jgi:heme/copper-type cytochrome/quinol oxidase subunit 2